MAFARIWQYVTSVVGYWQFWVAVAFMLERSLERYFPRLATPLNAQFPAERRRRIFVAIALLAFVYANFKIFDEVSGKLDEANHIILQGGTTEGRWPALTADEINALKGRVRALPTQEMIVACETVNCRDLADGIANILIQSGWKVTLLHQGGLDITGITGIRIEPNEPATLALKTAIRVSTKLDVAVGDESRDQRGPAPAILVVGTKPF